MGRKAREGLYVFFNFFMRWTYGARWPRVGLCPIFLVFLSFFSDLLTEIINGCVVTVG